MSDLILRTAALVIAALSLGLSFAHALEAPPRLGRWSAELWREVTVFNRQYVLFGAIGGPIEVAAVILVAGLSWQAVRQGPSAAPAVAAAALFLAALAVWILVVNPANRVMGRWTKGPPTAEVPATRRRWESGHLIMAALKLLGFASLALWAARAPGVR